MRDTLVGSISESLLTDPPESSMDSLDSLTEAPGCQEPLESLMGQAAMETEISDGWRRVRRPFKRAIEDGRNGGRLTLVPPEHWRRER